MNRYQAHRQPVMHARPIEPDSLSRRRLIAETLAFLFVVAVVIAAMSLDYRP